RVACVQPTVDVPGHAGDTQLLADVGAGARAAHGVEDQALWFEVQQQVADQVATAVAWVAPVAVLPGAVGVVEAGQVRHRAGVPGRPGQPGVHRLLRLGAPLRLVLPRGCDPLEAGGEEGIDGCECVHNYTSSTDRTLLSSASSSLWIRS